MFLNRFSKFFRMVLLTDWEAKPARGIKFMWILFLYLINGLNKSSRKSEANMCFKSVRKKSVYFFRGEIKGTIRVFYRLSTIHVHGTIEVIVLMLPVLKAFGIFWYLHTNELQRLWQVCTYVQKSAHMRRLARAFAARVLSNYMNVDKGLGQRLYETFARVRKVTKSCILVHISRDM